MESRINQPKDLIRAELGNKISDKDATEFAKNLIKMNVERYGDDRQDLMGRSSPNKSIEESGRNSYDAAINDTTIRAD
jgi:hypothetical protein